MRQNAVIDESTDQLCFAFVFDIEKAEAEAEKQRIKLIYDSLPFYECPKNDNERLLSLQYEYRHGNSGALAEIHHRLETIARKIIKTEQRKKRFDLEYYEVEDKAQNAADYILEQLIRRADFTMTLPTSYLYLRVKHELYYQKELEKQFKFIRICEENENEINYEYLERF